MSFCTVLFCSLCPAPHPRAWAVCLQDLLWYHANVPPWSSLPWKQLCYEEKPAEASLSFSICASSAHESGVAFMSPMVLTWALAGVLCPALCLAWLAGPQTYCATTSVSGYPWALPAPLCFPSFSKVGLDPMLARALPCLPSCCHGSWLPVLCKASHP